MAGIFLPSKLAPLKGRLLKRKTSDLIRHWESRKSRKIDIVQSQLVFEKPFQNFLFYCICCNNPKIGFWIWLSSSFAKVVTFLLDSISQCSKVTILAIWSSKYQALGFKSLVVMYYVVVSYRKRSDATFLSSFTYVFFYLPLLFTASDNSGFEKFKWRWPRAGASWGILSRCTWSQTGLEWCYLLHFETSCFALFL